MKSHNAASRFGDVAICRENWFQHRPSADHFFLLQFHSKYFYRFSLKGISQPDGKEKQWNGTAILPIIDNSQSAVTLRDNLRDALVANGSSCSVLVKQHGLLTFGKRWELALKE